LETLLVWLSRLILAVFGAGAAIWLARWLRAAFRERREAWAVRTGLLMLVLAGSYLAGHAWLLLLRDAIEQGREEYAVFGDPRRAEIRRAEVRGWLLDCTGEDANALARYGRSGDVVERVHPLGEGGANFIGGGAGAAQRDYTAERLFADRLREPRSWSERGQLHPAGRDLRLTVCRGATAEAARLLAATGRPGAIVVQDVASGAVVAYAATGGPDDPPLGIRRYAPPGSVYKLALAAVWWESGMPDVAMGCPASMEVAPRAVISNYGNFAISQVTVPRGMLVPSCNTTAVEMAMRLRDEIGIDAVLDAYRAFGFVPYAESAPSATDAEFWSTGSAAWGRRLAPATSRLRASAETGAAEWAQLAIGQGPLDVTVIGVSRFLQAIGNDGVMLRPTVEHDLAARPTEVARVMSAATAERLRSAMRAVVAEGTARGSAQARLRRTDWSLGGKTGTAQLQGRADDGWFAGLIHDPDGVPRYSVVVYLQGGGPGGGRPTAIAADLVRTLADQPRGETTIARTEPSGVTAGVVPDTGHGESEADG
jgi:hypothetical protein